MNVITSLSMIDKIPAGGVVVKVDGHVALLVGTNPMTVARAHEITDDIRISMVDTYGFRAIEDLGHTIACEMIQTFTLMQGVHNSTRKRDREKFQRLHLEAAGWAVALQVIEGCPFNEVTHFRKEQMTGINRLRQVTDLAGLQAYADKALEARS